MRRVSLPKTRPALLIVGTLMAVLMTVTAAQAVTGRTPARAGTTTPTAAAVPCQQLTGLDLTALPDAPTRIISATHVAATADKPAYCQVKGYVSPQIQFELRLPAQGWTGRYVQLGCGGFCGFAAPDNPNHFLPGGCAPPDDGRVVLGASNGGHIGVDSRDALWAHSDPQLRIDMAYRSEHVTALVAKAVTKAYYGQAPQYSYFAGCSNGGRQALMEAQRYPDDFDGIIAGAPGNNLVALAGEFFPWIATVNTDDKGRQILGPDKLPLLQSKVMQACDATDGLTDGLINNPRNCDFDPGTLRCPTASPQPTCLTRDQVYVVRKIYQGPVDAKGRRLFPAGLAKGTEAAWLGYVIAPQGQTGGLEALGYNYLKYFASWNNPPASYTLKDHRFDLRTFKKLREMSGIYDSTDPDLTRFRDRGGKLIMWHGWADPAIPTESTLAYHHALTQRMGGPKATGRFARTFLFPGVYHCVQGYGPDTFDLFTPIYDWVEKGAAPQKIIAAKKDGDRTVRTRPVYPYPMQTKYTGTGSIDDAANFTGVMPTEQPDDRYPWAGAPFRSDYQQTCRWEGTKLKCTRTRSA
ncbi:tannase/feruloyl esterase family alpha/beta hydrolase [Actinomadura sp. NPDC049382]|uniref:tannase/feruloyl esterase family alpha/beta hydrolase n=1 Tax=Actinomadura sp. NPDC049382 TaxID=3158220 RepID=UPI00341BF7DA